MKNDIRPIGVFDSGLGGLTTVSELRRTMPGENIVYFGDTGRVPYGTRSREIVRKYARQDIRFLLSRGVKMIIAACNTASASILPEDVRSLAVPFVEVLHPAVEVAAAATRNGKIGLIATPSTIRSGAYERAMRETAPDAQIVGAPCALFVPLVESGFTAPDNKVTRLVAEQYLTPILESGADTLDGLVAAAVAAGAQKGVAITNKIYPINDGAASFMAQTTMMQRINFGLIKKGVQIFDPTNTYIAPDADIAPGAVILPGCHIRPGCKVGAGAVIGPNSILEKAEIGAGTTVNNSQVYESKVGEKVTVGPFAYIRPQCVVGDGCRIGDFVELKKSTIGNGTKVSHLTYIGDATVGERVNFGCGTVVVNYDGYVKNQTVIGDDCFIGCNTNLVSPVKLGDRVFTAAGTTVTKDVPDGALAVARARQTTLDGWNDRRRAAHEKK